MTHQYPCRLLAEDLIYRGARTAGPCSELRREHYEDLNVTTVVLVTTDAKLAKQVEDIAAVLMGRQVL